MKPAKRWAKLIDDGEFAPTEALFVAVQRDAMEHIARLSEEHDGRLSAALIRALKPAIPR